MAQVAMTVRMDSELKKSFDALSHSDCVPLKI